MASRGSAKVSEESTAATALARTSKTEEEADVVVQHSYGALNTAEAPFRKCLAAPISKVPAGNIILGGYRQADGDHEGGALVENNGRRQKISMSRCQLRSGSFSIIHPVHGVPAQASHRSFVESMGGDRKRATLSA